MICATSIEQLRQQQAAWRKAGQSLALVPTMGNLHQGHLSLVQAARAVADRLVVSIFVNPLQFSAGEDFDRYPRTLETDCALLAEAGVDMVFAPSEAELYPRGRAGLIQVQVPGLGDDLCGRTRPGHFNGVATVVTKLFNLVQPDLALFGRKDYQQLLVIQRLVADLNLSVRIVGLDTVREADGLALSSRNQYLSQAERQRAPLLYKTLQALAQRLQSARAPGGQLDALLDEARRQLEAQGFGLEYLELRRAADLSVAVDVHSECLLLVAAWLGKTRLLDNLSVHPFSVSAPVSGDEKA